MTVLIDPPVPVVGDIFRIVTFTTGGRPTTVLDLNDGAGYYRDRDAGITYTPGTPTVQYSRTYRRYGGARAVGETHDNGGIAWTAYIRGSSDTDARRRVEALLTEIEQVARSRYLQWGPAGGPSTYLEIAGPGTWTPSVYRVREFAEQHTLAIQIAFPVLPLTQWDRPKIGDDFATDTISDYTFDAGDGLGVAITGGTLRPGSSSLTTLRRMRHTARGYSHMEGQATVKAVVPSTVTNFRVGVQLRATATTGVDIYVDDTGTNSRLRVDVNTGSGWVNRYTANLAARMVAAANVYVRGRIEGNSVWAEYWTTGGVPTPIGAPTFPTTPGLPAVYTLTGTETTMPVGQAGLTWTPQSTDARINTFEFSPFVRRAMTFPAVVDFADEIPGTAPALADVSMTVIGSGQPVFGLVGWWPGDIVMYGIYEAESGSSLSGWAVASSGAGHGTPTNNLLNATVSGAQTLTATYTVNATGLADDDFSPGEVMVEVWARVLVDVGLVTPRLAVSATSSDGATFGGTRYTAEWGVLGRPLIQPTATSRPAFTRLGTIMLPTTHNSKITLTGTTQVGSTGSFGVDYFMLAPARGRALSPSGIANDSSYPRLFNATAQATKTIRSDLSGAIASPPNTPYPDHGLNGSLIMPPPGKAWWLVKLSSDVPDDPTPSGGTLDATDYSATLELDVVPRGFLLRS